MTKPRRTIAAALLLLWFVSLLLPAVTYGGAGYDPNTWAGWGILLTGWMGVLGLQFGWLANPLFIAACVLIGIGKPPGWGQTVIGIALLLLLLDSWTWDQFPTESGESQITQYHVGYFLWFLPIGLVASWMLVASFNHQLQKKWAPQRGPDN